MSPRTRRVVELLENPVRSKEMGACARRHVVENGSIEVMVSGYERLIESIYLEKMSSGRGR